MSKPSFVRLSKFPVYDESVPLLENCPSCHTDRIKKTPRRGPAMFHCTQCGFIASYDDVAGAHWILCHQPAA